MKQSQLFYRTEKSAPKEAEAVSHKLLLRAGFIDQLMAGVYTFLPLGLKVLKKIECIIRQNMIDLGGQEILMPALNPKENWQKTGRWSSFDALFKLKGSGDKDYALAPTHEEIIAPLARSIVFSYKDLPFYLFHIQTKFRNEARAKSGILRTREFLMKDLYSFHADEQDLDDYYLKAAKTYLEIYEECGIGKDTYQTLASGGTFSKFSHEFQTVTESGEDVIHICEECGIAINDTIKEENKVCPNFPCRSTKFRKAKAVEVGNIFKLGTKYSLPFGLKFRSKDGVEKLVTMGCYGIGLGRLMGAIVEVNNDKDGIIWPSAVAPFQVHLVQIGDSAKIKKIAEKIYQNGQKAGLEVLYDDRKDKAAGEKFVEADLIGLPYRLIVSDRTVAKNSVEFKARSSVKTELVKTSQIVSFLKKKC